VNGIGKQCRTASIFSLPFAMRTKKVFLGFSSCRFTEGKHRTAVYARGDAARIGVERALFDRAEAAALEHGATEIHVDASLAAVQFYIARGFEELAPGQHRMRNGAFMDCVFMKKKIGQTHIRPSDLFPKGSLVQHAMSCFAMLEPSEASFKMNPCVGKAKRPFEN
jgi:hypothetical protein